MPGIPRRTLLMGTDEALREILDDVPDVVPVAAAIGASTADLLRHLDSEAPPDLVVLDFDMPGASDPACIEVLAKRQPCRPLLLVGASFDDERLTDILPRGTSAFVKKPFAKEDIQESVQSLLGTGEQDEGFRGQPSAFGSLMVLLEYRTDEIDPGRVGDRLASILAATDFWDAKSAAMVEMAVHEALVNAVEHGCLELSSGLKPEAIDEQDEFSRLRETRLRDERFGSRKIRVCFHVDPSRMEVSIRDEGPGFDHAAVMASLKDRTEPQSLMECHGRGLLMVACAMDDVSFNETGSEITFIRYSPTDPDDNPDRCRMLSE